jgi:hypothetical protein
MIVSTIVAWLSWFLIVFYVNPDESGISSLILFYFTLITGLIGTLTLIGMLYRIVFKGRRDVLSREVKISFRHAILLSAIAVGSLALSASEYLYWWVILVFIAVACIIEYLFIMMQQSNRG